MSNYVPGREPTCPVCGVNKIKSRRATQCDACHKGYSRPVPVAAPPAAKPLPPIPVIAPPDPPAETPADSLPDILRKQLGKGPASLTALAATCRATPGRVLDVLLEMQQRGATVREVGGQWTLEKGPALGLVDGVGPFLSDREGRHRYGWIGDTHLASKYARLDALRDIYQRFADEGIQTVFHTGNWIDGEAPFNTYDLLVHGMDAQIDYLAQEYPSVPGLTTYAVAGNDHEGWYGKREGIDIGKHAHRLMQAAGRSDWVHLGHMEAFVPAQHAATGQQAMLHVMHPGGGSAYAVSYTVQKIVEGYEGGDKPAVLFAGHYHKMEFICTRNVWVIQTACVQDQTPFARQKKLRFEIGAGICELEQDGETGAILGCKVAMWQYFNRGFYNGRWSPAGPVTLPERKSA